MKFLLILLCVFPTIKIISQEPVVIGVGSCTIDFLVQVEDSFIEENVPTKKGGGFSCSGETIDEVLAKTDKLPKVIPGGSSANFVRALSKLGQPCAFLSHVGQDIWGSIFSDNLKEYAVDLRLSPSPLTSRVLCLISPDGQRTFLGFNVMVEDLAPSKEDLKEAKWIHFEARHLMNPGYVEKSMALAKELGMKISIDLSAVYVIEEYKKNLEGLISEYVDIVFCNQDEVLAFTGLCGDEGCLKLQRMCPVAVVTLGHEGCVVGHKENLIHVSGFGANVVDTTGAGDYFTAGFVYGQLHNQSLAESAQIGNLLGSAIVEVIGTELSQERWNLLRKISSNPPI